MDVSSLTARYAALLFPLALAACAEGTPLLAEASGTTGAGGAGGDGGGATTTLASTTGNGGGGDPWNGLPWDGNACAEPTQFIYVVTTTSDLLRFWPPTRSFEHVGHLDCPTDGWSPMSMAVDRHAQAWVLYWDQVVYKLDLASGDCVESGYNAEHALPGPFGYFGMAFTADASAPDEESLFVRGVAFYDEGADPGARPLGRFDVTQGAIGTVGQGLGANADLAGTGDGRLFGFEKLPDAPADGASQLDEFDPATGERIAVTDLAGLTIGDAWAVAAWGGDIWLFSSSFEGSTRVVRYRPSTGTTEVVLDDVGFEVVGAGVSACAPVEPPS